MSTSRARITFLVAALVVASGLLAQETRETPRTPDGRPDLSGMYDTATLTPLERPVELGDNLLLTPEEAESIRAKEAARTERLALPSDVDRDAPPLGGDGSTGAAGNVGGYNNFWIDRGTEAFSLEGKVRTSIIVHPPNGRTPEMTPAGTKRRAAWFSPFGKNTGEAWCSTGQVPALTTTPKGALSASVACWPSALRQDRLPCPCSTTTSSASCRLRTTSLSSSRWSTTRASSL